MLLMIIHKLLFKVYPSVLNTEELSFQGRVSTVYRGVLISEGWNKILHQKSCFRTGLEQMSFRGFLYFQSIL